MCHSQLEINVQQKHVMFKDVSDFNVLNAYSSQQADALISYNQ